MTMPWIVVDLSQDPPVETERDATAEEIAAAQTHLEAVEARELELPPETVEARLTAIEAELHPEGS